MSIEQAFGIILRQLRTSKGLSQETLGFFCEYHRTYISQLERGLKSPTLRAIFDLAKALEITPQQMISLVEQELAHQPSTLK